MSIFLANYDHIDLPHLTPDVPSPQPPPSPSQSRQSAALQEVVLSKQVEHVMAKIIPIQPADLYLTGALLEKTAQIVALLLQYLPETRAAVLCIVFSLLVIK